MEKVEWKVKGMTCANCALTINQFLKKEGAQNISVSTIDGDVSFDFKDSSSLSKLENGIESLGYKVEHPNREITTKQPFLKNNIERFFFCLPFTVVLMLHMIPGVHIHFLMNAWIQLLLTIPVYAVGMYFFGRSAWKSIRNGMPNMNVLIAIGASAAFIYSLIGTVFHLGNSFLFYETSAAIITLVFFGNYLEEKTVQSTHKSLNELIRHEKIMANMIAYDNEHNEHIFPVDASQLKVGDLLLIKNGEQAPADVKILSGNAYVDESLLTGESTPVYKVSRDTIISGSVIVEGIVKTQVTAVGKDTVLSGIIRLVKKAESEKPPVQKLADKISAVFVPVVLSISVLTIGLNWVFTHDFTTSLIRGIAVLVISCPCAMGLATPAAIAVGMGRGARLGILYRDAGILELFSKIKTIVFDKTGTLTTGKFSIKRFETRIDEETFKKIIFSIEKHSTHPLAKSISEIWKTKSDIRWRSIEEIKGRGMKAIDLDNNSYWCGSQLLEIENSDQQKHNVYLYKNNDLIGWIDLEDDLRPEASDIVRRINNNGYKTILLSGDTLEKTNRLAQELGIKEVMAEKKPEEKLQILQTITKETPSIMVGDGINDAAALAKSTIGISMSNASQLAIQTSQVVLIGNSLNKLITAIELGKQTYSTIKQNLGWAFIYNVIAIPIAAFGLLGTYGPTYGALLMAFSDVVLILNSIRLLTRKLP